MEITKSSEDGNRFYELVLSKRDFDDLCSGCPDGGFILGRHVDVYFYIFDGNNFSDSWRQIDGGYFLNVGIEAPVPPPNATFGVWDAYAQIFYNNLEKAINKSGRIPIEGIIVLLGEKKTINLGYVVMKVEPERS